MKISGCSTLEYANHLFLHRSFFGSIWNYILSLGWPFDGYPQITSLNLVSAMVELGLDKLL